MTPLRYVTAGVVCGTLGLVLTALARVTGSDDLVAVATFVAVIFYAVAAVLVLIGAVGAGVRAGRRED